MYWGQSSGRGSDLSLRRFLAEVIHSHERPLGGFKPSLVHVFWRGRGGSLLWREDRVMDITRVQAPNLVLSHRVDASSPGSCVTWQDAANLTTFWSIWHATVSSHTNAKWLRDKLRCFAFFSCAIECFSKETRQKTKYLCRFSCILQLYLHRVDNNT